ncbi:N-acyl homoserine lactonase family protein [Undibacterium sp.]|uniref:N-acyl homoserine lactonase family protein n=1 Tax=Undibacterium sp. TaxID=1914977 RepID=UPI00374DF4F7
MAKINTHILTAAAMLAAAALTGCAQMKPPTTQSTQSAQSTVQRLYVLYCGEAHIPDVSPWSPGFNAGKAAVFSDNCYLIQHGKDWMMWDTGYTDALADKPDGILIRNSRAMRTRTLASQLAEIGVAPAQITYLAFSHTHADHTGNGNLFTAATLYIQQPEYDAAFGPEPAKYGFMPASYDKLRANPIVKLHGDFDVFGDGSVTILSTPGHTPGHQSLLVRLPKTGAVVLSGDVAHFEENFVNRRVPGFNFNAQQSQESMDKVDRILKTEHAQLWINHDSKQNATIAHAPQFIE